MRTSVVNHVYTLPLKLHRENVITIIFPRRIMRFREVDFYFGNKKRVKPRALDVRVVDEEINKKSDLVLRENTHY